MFLAVCICLMEFNDIYQEMLSMAQRKDDLILVVTQSKTWNQEFLKRFFYHCIHK